MGMGGGAIIRLVGFVISSLLALYSTACLLLEGLQGRTCLVLVSV